MPPKTPARKFYQTRFGRWFLGLNVVTDATVEDVHDCLVWVAYLFVGAAAAIYFPILLFFILGVREKWVEILRSGEIAVLAFAVTIPALLAARRNRKVKEIRVDKFQLSCILLIVLSLILMTCSYVVKSEVIIEDYRKGFQAASWEYLYLLLFFLAAWIAYTSRLIELKRDAFLERFDLADLSEDRIAELQRRVSNEAR